MNPPTTTLAFESFGARIAIRTDDAALLDRLELQLPPAAVRIEPEGMDTAYTVKLRSEGVGAGDPRYELSRDGESVVSSGELSAIQREI